MARLTAKQAATFPTQTGANMFLSLPNDKDSAKVRFAYVNVEDIPIHLVHDVQGEDGRYKQVGCLRTDYSEPDSVCPLCAGGLVPKKTIYFNVRNEETGEMQLWQRSQAFFEKNMLTYFNEYTANGTPLCSIPFKIIRSGAKGDMKTTYSFVALPADGMQLEEFPEDIIVEEIGIVNDFSFQQLQNYIQTGQWPNAQGQAEVTPRGAQPVENARGAQPANQQAPVNTNRRTIMNNSGY